MNVHNLLAVNPPFGIYIFTSDSLVLLSVIDFLGRSRALESCIMLPCMPHGRLENILKWSQCRPWSTLDWRLACHSRRWIPLRPHTGTLIERWGGGGELNNNVARFSKRPYMGSRRTTNLQCRDCRTLHRPSVPQMCTGESSVKFAKCQPTDASHVADLLAFEVFSAPVILRMLCFACDFR